MGADSTSTRSTPDGSQRYLDNEQKVFEVGEHSALAVVTWGLGAIGAVSHRTHVARLADDLTAIAPKTVEEAAIRFANQLWSDYDKTFRADIDKLKATLGDPASDPPDRAKAQAVLENLAFGFCIGGRVTADRTPQAYEIWISADLPSAPAPIPVTGMKVWGANLFAFRALGLATNAAKDIIATGKWGGSVDELERAMRAGATPISPMMPLRETLDAVNCLLQMTVKLMKYTGLPPTCGGPIELATVTSDRHFRWVRHKRLSAALSAGELNEQ